MQRKLDLTITLDITTTRQPQDFRFTSELYGRLEKQFQYVYTFSLSAVLLQTFVETMANTRFHRLKICNTSLVKSN